MPAGRPSLLTDDVIRRAGELADVGLPSSAIAARLGIHLGTWNRWLKKGRDADDDSNEARLCAVINRSVSELTERYLNSLHGQAELGNVNAITWLLTHSPHTREHWSDAAAERRAVQRSQERTVAAIESSTLAPEQKQELLLRLAASGEHPDPLSVLDVA